jgi:NTE family protein
MNQAAALRKRWLIASFIKEDLAGTYWGIGSAVADYKRAGGYSNALVKEHISRVRTDLDCFSAPEQAVLENHGYLLADAAIAAHDDELPTLKRSAEAPFPGFMDEARVRSELIDSDRRQLFGRWRRPAWLKGDQ